MALFPRTFSPSRLRCEPCKHSRRVRTPESRPAMGINKRILMGQPHCTAPRITWSEEPGVTRAIRMSRSSRVVRGKPVPLRSMTEYEDSVLERLQALQRVCGSDGCTADCCEQQSRRVRGTVPSRTGLAGLCLLTTAHAWRQATKRPKQCVSYEPAMASCRIRCVAPACYVPPDPCSLLLCAGCGRGHWCSQTQPWQRSSGMFCRLRCWPVHEV